MNRNDILRRFQRASEGFIQANIPTGDSGKAAVVERDLGNGTLGQEEVQRRACSKFFIRVTSVRHRLIDQDNLCEKYHVDLCRYASIIPDDSPDKLEIEVCQIKAGKGQQEKTIIEVFEIE